MKQLKVLLVPLIGCFIDCTINRLLLLCNSQELCKRGSELLESKSARVEEAANELIAILLELDEEEEEEEDELDSDEDQEKLDDLPKDQDDGAKEEIVPRAESARSRPRTGGSRPDSRTAGSRLGSAVISPAAAAAKRKRETRDQLNMEAQELLMHFIHKNVDAIVRVTRTTLDGMRKRVQAAIAVHYLENSNSLGQGPDLSPLFLANVTLQIPNITMQPALDEIQQGLNKAAQYVVSVSKGVSQWNKTCKALIKTEKKEKDDSDNEARSRSASNAGSDDESRSDVAPSRRVTRMPADSDTGTVVSMAIFPQRANYYKNVAENKEIAKLVSFLSTAINSQKKDVTTALQFFTKYEPTWKEDREEEIAKYLETDPKLSEFEAQILRYKALEETIMKEPESYKAGAIALFTGIV